MKGRAGRWTLGDPHQTASDGGADLQGHCPVLTVSRSPPAQEGLLGFINGQTSNKASNPWLGATGELGISVSLSLKL